MEDVSSLHRHFRLTSYIGASTTSLTPRSQRRWMRNIPFKQNRTTKLTGKLYTATAPGSTAFQVNEDWLDDLVVPF